MMLMYKVRVKPKAMYRLRLAETKDPAQVIRSNIAGIIAGLVLLIVGAVVMTVAANIGRYIVNALRLNNTNPIDYTDDVTGVVGLTLTVAGTAIIITAATFILRELMSTAKEFASTTW